MLTKSDGGIAQLDVAVEDASRMHEAQSFDLHDGQFLAILEVLE